MSIHVKREDGKPKCGARPWGYSLGIMFANEKVEANCRRCLGTVEKRYETIQVPKEYLGKILHRSFGYDMTINVYAKIIKINAKSATAVELKTMVVAGDPWGPGSTGKARPCHEPVGKPFIVYLKKSKNYDYQGWSGNGSHWSIWNGESNYENHWD